MDTEPTQETFLARAGYLGATADELGQTTAGDKVAAAIRQKALFQRRGQMTLERDRLVLADWGDAGDAGEAGKAGEAGDLELAPEDITSVRTVYTELYGRFIGCLLKSGKPLILETTVTGEIYLLFDREESPRAADDPGWERRINHWLASAR